VKFQEGTQFPLGFIQLAFTSITRQLDPQPIGTTSFDPGSAIFGVFCRHFGVPLIDGGTVRLPRAIGMSRALDLILTGRPVNAEEALQMGLANRVVKSSELHAEARKLALQIAGFPQACMRNDRRSAYQQWGMSEADAISNEFRLGVETLNSGETVAGAARFAGGEGRHAKFEK